MTEQPISKITDDDKVSHSLAPYLFDEQLFDKTKNEALHDCIRAKHGENIRTPQTLRQEFGSEAEHVCLRVGCRRLGLTNVQHPILEKVEHPLLPLQGSLDGMAEADNLTIENSPERGIYLPNATKITVNGRCPIEVKTTSMRATDDPPNGLGVMQLKAAMSTTQSSFGVLICLFNSTDLRVFVYQRDYEFEDELAVRVKDFDRRIREEDYFTPQISRDAHLLNKSVDDEAVIELEDSFHVDQYVSLKEKKKEIEKQIDYHQSQIMNSMGNASKAIHEDFVVSWPMINYKAKPEKVVPAKDAYSVRRKTITVKRANK